MTDDLQRLALARSISSRLHAASLDELRLVDKLLTRLEQRRFTWRRRVATGPGDVDTRWHLAVTGPAMVVTRCEGRWPATDAGERHDCPPVLERCLACQRAAWRGTELDALIAAALEELAEEDRERAGLREAARIEMLGPPRSVVCGGSITPFGTVATVVATQGYDLAAAIVDRSELERWRELDATRVSPEPARIAFDDLREHEPYEGFDVSDLGGEGG